MLSQQNQDIFTSGHIDPKYKNQNHKDRNAIPFVINGCVVSITSSAEKSDDVLNEVKMILLSAYRSRMASC